MDRFRAECQNGLLGASGEELGLLGSTAYAIDRAKEGEAIQAALQVDMIGIPGEPLGVYSDELSTWILDRAGHAATSQEYDHHDFRMAASVGSALFLLR